MEVILNGLDMLSVENLHQHLANKFDFPEYYGRNLDALWDLLSAWVETPVTVIWNNYEASHQHLGVYAETVLNLFRDAEKDVKGFNLLVSE